MTLSRKTAPWMRKYGPMMAKRREGQQLELRTCWSCNGLNAESVRRRVAYIPSLEGSACDTLRPLPRKPHQDQLRTHFSTRRLRRGLGRDHGKPCRCVDNHQYVSSFCYRGVSPKRALYLLCVRFPPDKFPTISRRTRGSVRHAAKADQKQRDLRGHI